MEVSRGIRNAVAIGILFLVVGIIYLVLAEPIGYEIEWAGVTMLVALGAAMGLMTYVLIDGSPRD